MYHSIRGEFALTDNLNVFGGVDNLTDSLPPFGQFSVAGGNPYDSIGRYFHLGMTIDL